MSPLPVDRVLDIDTGRGWPALYLSAIYGCEVVASDVPIEGLKIGARRARRDEIDGQVRFAAARAEVLPFRDASFDAVVHTDTLCCAHHKLSVLRECARLLRPGGRMAFLTIHPVPGLEAADMERAIECGPPEVAHDESHEQMLALAGFSEIESVDVTAAFSATQQGWVDAWRAREDALIALLGRAPVAERKADRAALRAGIDEGLFRRTLYVAQVATAFSSAPA